MQMPTEAGATTTATTITTAVSHLSLKSNRSIDTVPSLLLASPKVVRIEQNPRTCLAIGLLSAFISKKQVQLLGACLVHAVRIFGLKYLCNGALLAC